MRMNSILSKLRPLVSTGRTTTQGSMSVKRSFAADAHGEIKYNAWEKPTQISKWKEEHIVFLVLGGWGVAITTAMKVFGGKNKEEAGTETTKEG